MGIESFVLDLNFIKRFCQLLISVSKDRLTIVLLILLLILALSEQIFIYNVGLITSGYYKILVDKDLSQFWIYTIKALLLVSGQVLLKNVKEYVSSLLYLKWRKSICLRLHSLYFNGIAYYQLNVIDRKIDNPDQRITQDVDKMCDQLTQVLPNLIVAPFTAVFYSYKY